MKDYKVHMVAIGFFALLGLVAWLTFLTNGVALIVVFVGFTGFMIYMCLYQMAYLVVDTWNARKARKQRDREWNRGKVI